jgi:hypothetical protein
VTSWKESGLPTATSSREARFFFSPGQYQRSPLAEQLGCEFCEGNNCIQCGEDTATNIPGVYAAGNASRGVQLVIAAAAEGMQAGRSPLIVRSSKRMLQVTRYVATSPGNLSMRIALRPVLRPLIKREWRADWVFAMGA